MGGVNETNNLTGVGCCWSYDAVGSHERVSYSSSGTGQQLVQPLLDNQVSTSSYLSSPLVPHNWLWVRDKSFSFFIIYYSFLNVKSLLISV